MRAQNMKNKKNKSLGKTHISKTISTNKNTSLKIKGNKKKAKSKSKELKPKRKQISAKTNSKMIKDNNLNMNYGYNYNNIKNGYYTYDNNYNINSNMDINNNINSLRDFSLNGNQMINSISSNYKTNFENTNSLNLLLKSNQNIDKQNIFQKSMDRLLVNSQNLLEKQNIILSECDSLTKNIATNDYAIQNLINNEDTYNYENLMKYYNNNITGILSKIKKNNIDFELNMKLKNENNSLKSKIELANLDKEDNLQIKSIELNNLKTVLCSEINRVLNILNGIGYDNLPIDKMEITNINSQKLLDFFQVIIKIIKQMKELIQNKETMISKMTIEQITNRSKNNSNLDNIINKSYEKLSMDYNNNLGLKNYNFSVRNNILNKTYNISFRNNPKINKDMSIIEKTQKSLNINEINSNRYFLNMDKENDKIINNSINQDCVKNKELKNNKEEFINYGKNNDEKNEILLVQDILNMQKNEKFN